MIETSGVSTLLLDGTLVDATMFQQIPGTNVSVAHLEVAAGTHSLDAQVPFGVVAYGYAKDDIYSYTGGSGIAPVNRVASLDLTSHAANGIVGVAVPFSAIVRDSGGNAVAGVRVDFVVNGVNGTNGFAYSDAMGVARFSVTGLNTGSDTITATVAAFSDSSTILWTNPAAPPTITLDDPTGGQSAIVGQTLFVTGRAFAGTLSGRITLVTINGTPVEGIDAAGRFFTRLTAVEGANVITAVAQDDQGQTATATITVTGMAQDSSVNGFATTALSTRMVYSNTTFNRHDNRLLVDAVVQNLGTTRISGPIAVASRDFDPADVTLHGVPLSDNSHPTVRFDDAISVGGTSGSQRLAFDDARLSRFDFNVDFLAPSNAPPVFSSVPRVDVVAGQQYTATALATDPDGDPVTYYVVNGPAGFEIDATTGVMSWTPATELRGPVRIEIEARDERGATAYQEFQIDVRDPALNRAPVFTSLPTLRIDSGANYSYTPTVFDGEGDAQSFADSVLPAGLSIDPSSGTITGTALATGNYPIRLIVSDGRGGIAEQAYTLSVGIAESSAVAITSIPPELAVADRQYTYLPQASSAAGLPITFALLNPLSEMSFDTQTGQITWTPGNDRVGPHAFVLVASDGLASAKQTFIIDVRSSVTNRAPVITSRPSLLATQGEDYSYTPAAFDPDGDPFAFALTAESKALGFTLDAATRTIHWTPTPTQLGSYRVEVQAIDSPLGAIGRQSFVVEVRPFNTAPTLTSSPVTTFNNALQFTATLSAIDAEGDAVRFSLGTDTQAGMRINPINGEFIWLAGHAEPGTHIVTVLGTDERGAVGSTPLTITVTADTQAPNVAIAVNPQRVDPGQPATIRVFSTDNVGVTTLTLTANGVAVPLDGVGQAVYTPTAPGVVRLVATAIDRAGNTTTATSSLSVADPSDVTAPTMTITGPHEGAVVSYLTEITGTIDDAYLVDYKVELSRFDTNEWRTIQTGTTPVNNGVIATLDPTLLDSDTYSVRITATDVNGQVTTHEFTIDLTGQTKIGNFRQEFVDLQLPLAGVPITITRVYDSLKADQSSDFGFGWSLGAGYDPRFREAVVYNPGEEFLGMFAATGFKQGTRVYLNTPDGRRVGFTFEPKPYTDGFNGVLDQALYAPYFKPDPGVYETLQGEYDTVAGYALPLIMVRDRYYLAAISVPYNPLGYRLTTKDGLVYHTHQTKGLQSITDRNGVKLTFTRDSITSSLGQAITFQRDAQGRITQITDPEGNPITYSYNTAGDLIEKQDQVGTTSHFAYSEVHPHYLTDINNEDCGCASSIPPMRIEYDENGRLASSRDLLGNIISAEHDVENRREVIRDALGQETVLYYDARGNVLNEVDAFGHTKSYTYDANDNQLTIVDANGHTTTSTYDGRGNKTSIANALGHVSQLEYNALDKLTRAVDAEGRDYHYDYDPRGNLVRISAPAIDGNSDDVVTTFTYSKYGHVLEAIDGRGSTTAFSYVIWMRSPYNVENSDGSFSFAGYDGMGRLRGVRDENGFLSLFDFDNGSRLSKVTGPVGGFVTMVYDGDRVTEMTDSLGRTVSIGYDAAHRKTSVTDAEGKTTLYNYDGNGDLTAMTDARGFTTKYSYRSDRRLQTETRADGGVITYDYDGVGNVVSIIDPNGHTTGFVYDAADRLIERTAADSGVTKYAYDKVGSATSMTDALGRISTYSYDNYNRLIGMLDAEGGASSYAYDATGNLLLQTDANGHTTNYDYDSRSRMVAMTDPLGHVTHTSYDAVGNVIAVTDALDRVQTYSYDGKNRLRSMTDALGHSMGYAYDSEGQLVSRTDQRGFVTSYAYDKVGRLTQTTDALNQVTTRAYDAQGNLVTFTDANGHATAYTYDGMNRLDTRTDARGGVTAYDYDLAGNLLTFTDANGHASKYSYDEMDRLAKQTDALGHQSQYDYDLIGNMVTMTDANNHVTSYGFDKLNRQVSMTDARNGITAYDYDPVGNLISLIDANGNITNFSYDANGRLVSETDPYLKLRTFEYDAVDNLIASTDRNARRREFNYDTLDRRTSEVWKAVDGSDAYTATYSYDADSNLLNAGDTNSTYSYEYDALSRVVTVGNAGTPKVPNVVFNTTYDAVGNHTSIVDNFGVRVDSIYDERNLLSSRSWSGGGIAESRFDLTYDAAGQRISLDRYSDMAGTQLVAAAVEAYDPLNRLLQRTTSKADATRIVDYRYTYDPAGRVLSESHHGETTNYNYDSTDQILSADHTSQIDESYGYDLAGNHTGDGQTVDIGNRITADAEFDYAYDDEGNLITKTERASGEVTEFTYDYRNRLVEVVRRSAGGILLSQSEFTYDVFDRLIVREVDGVKQSTIYDGDHVWADFASDNTVSTRYLHGGRVDELLARWQPSTGQAWYLADKQGTIRDIINASANVVGQLAYDTFGKISATTGNVDRFAFQGREWEAAIGQYQFRVRWYDPTLRQFTSEDPLGFAAGDANLKRFVGNNPPVFTDPSGMLAFAEATFLRGAANLTIDYLGCMVVAAAYKSIFSLGKTGVFENLVNASAKDWGVCFIIGTAQFLPAAFALAVGDLRAIGQGAGTAGKFGSSASSAEEGWLYFSTAMSGKVSSSPYFKPPQSPKIYTATEDIGKILSSGRVWGQTEGSVYGMATPNASRLRSMANPKVREPGLLIFEGKAASLFKRHPLEGAYSGLKRALGQYKSKFGDIQFDPSRAGIRKLSDGKIEVTISEATIGSHQGQSELRAAYRLLGRRVIIEPLATTAAAGLVYKAYQAISSE